MFLNYKQHKKIRKISVNSKFTVSSVLRKFFTALELPSLNDRLTIQSTIYFSHVIRKGSYRKSFAELQFRYKCLLLLLRQTLIWCRLRSLQIYKTLNFITKYNHVFVWDVIVILWSRRVMQSLRYLSLT